jgi:DNA-binding transcriptional LysR family regulator
MIDIVAERFDAGVRLGDRLAKDMIAVRIAADLRMSVVAAPAYFAKRPPSQSPHGLSAHDCISLRLPTHGGLYAWEFENDGHALNVRVEGQLVLDSSMPMLRAALLPGYHLYYPSRLQASSAFALLVDALRCREN